WAADRRRPLSASGKPLALAGPSSRAGGGSEVQLEVEPLDGEDARARAVVRGDEVDVEPAAGHGVVHVVADHLRREVLVRHGAVVEAGADLVAVVGPRVPRRDLLHLGVGFLVHVHVGLEDGHAVDHHDTKRRTWQTAPPPPAAGAGDWYVTAPSGIEIRSMSNTSGRFCSTSTSPVGAATLVLGTSGRTALLPRFTSNWSTPMRSAASSQPARPKAGAAWAR